MALSASLPGNRTRGVTDIQATLEEIRAAVRRGDHVKARRLTARLLERYPTCVEALLWRAWLAETPRVRLEAARRAHALAPHDPRVQKALRWAEQHMPPGPAQSTWIPRPQTAVKGPLSQRSPITKRSHLIPFFLVFSLVLLVAVLVVGMTAWTFRPQTPPSPSPLEVALERANVAWAMGDYDSAANFLEEAYRLAPDDGELRLRLAQAHMKAATVALEASDPEAALPHLEAARALYPREEAILREYQALRAYLAGRDAFNAGRWEEAIQTLAPLYQLDPFYLNVTDMLNRALVAQWEIQRQQEATAARTLHQVRLARPGQTAAALLKENQPASYPGQAALASVPPLVPPVNKRIVVDISEQRMYVYENGRLKWSWVVSTGEPKRPTVPGEYRVQSKIRNARSNVWRLWMPWWLGIYWVGSVENGIHGLPVSDAGYKMWEGYLGRRVSYGCIVLSDENARRLWEWADIGTPVTIRW